MWPEQFIMSWPLLDRSVSWVEKQWHPRPSQFLTDFGHLEVRPIGRCSSGQRRKPRKRPKRRSYPLQISKGTEHSSRSSGSTRVASLALASHAAAQAFQHTASLHQSVQPGFSCPKLQLYLLRKVYSQAYLLLTGIPLFPQNTPRNSKQGLLHHIKQLSKLREREAR